jgi:hypothetical protein
MAPNAGLSRRMPRLYGVSKVEYEVHGMRSVCLELR